MTHNQVLTHNHGPKLLGRSLLDALNARDVDAIVALYEEDAVLGLPDGGTACGHDEIRSFYAALIKDAPRFAPGTAAAPLIMGDLALGHRPPQRTHRLGALTAVCRTGPPVRQTYRLLPPAASEV